MASGAHASTSDGRDRAICVEWLNQARLNAAEPGELTHDGSSVPAFAITTGTRFHLCFRLGGRFAIATRVVRAAQAQAVRLT